MIPGNELLSKPSTEVFETFKERQNQMEKTVENFRSMQLLVDELMAASKKQSDTFDNIAEMIHLGLKTQNKILLAVQDVQGKSNGPLTLHIQGHN